MEEASDIETWERLLNEQTALFRRTAWENVTLRSRVEELERELGVWKDAQKSAYSAQQETAKEVARLQRNIESLKDDNPLILCLIDGDGNIFLPELIRQGHAGGRAAAQMLTKGLTEHLTQSQGENGPAARGKVWLTVYCNKYGLSEVLSANQLATQEAFEAFVTGFNQASPLFSIVDVGNGKEAADAKIKECLLVFTRFPQTSQVFFGGSHDNSYASTLHQLENEGLLEKITILRGYKDLARELKNLNLPIAEVEGVFMTQKIPSFYPKKGPAVQTAKLDGLQELPASSPLSSSSPKKKPMDSLKPPKYLDPTIPMSKNNPPPCNFYYLSECAAGAKCRFGHDYVLSQTHISELRENARLTPCPHANRNKACPNGEGCVYGHVCPRGKTCHFLKQGKCRFTGQNMHTKDAAKKAPHMKSGAASSATNTNQSSPRGQSSSPWTASPMSRDGALPVVDDVSPSGSVWGGTKSLSPPIPQYWPYPAYTGRPGSNLNS